MSQQINSGFAPVSSNAASARAFAVHVILFTLMFPFLQILPLQTDTQPNFLLAFVLLSPVFLKTTPEQVAALFATIVVLLAYTINAPDLSPLRAWGAYLTPLFVVAFAHVLSMTGTGIARSDRWMIWAFWAWVVFGGLQWASSSTLLELTYRASTTDDRGWMSFGPEPSAYSTMLFLFAAYFMAGGSWILPLVAFGAALLFAQSTVGLIYFVILGLVYMTVAARLALLWATLLVAAVLTVLTVNLEPVIGLLPQDMRMTQLLTIFATKPHLIFEDGSIASRSADLVLAIETFTTGKIFGNGFTTGIRLKSGWGALVYELGIFGLAYAVAYIGIFMSRAVKTGRRAVAATLAIVIVMFSSTSLSLPFATFVVAMITPRATAGFAPASGLSIRKRFRFK